MRSTQNKNYTKLSIWGVKSYVDLYKMFWKALHFEEMS